jgi:hypothetical protein
MRCNPFTIDAPSRSTIAAGTKLSSFAILMSNIVAHFGFTLKNAPLLLVVALTIFW